MSEKQYIERYWRDATPEDASKEPPMVARFRIDETDKWSVDTLQGFDRSVSFRWIGQHNKGKHCQVYDAPDPGEGWRLIDPDKDDYRQDGIEYLNNERHEWTERLACKHTPFQSLIYYRIRITPTVTYVPFTWEDREQLRGRWIYRSKDGNTIEEIAFKFDSRVFNAVAKHLLEDGWKFLDTGKPVGKEVVQ